MAKRGHGCRSTQDTPLINIQARPQSNCTTIPNGNSGAGSSSCNSSTTTASKKQTQMMSEETTPRIERILVDDDKSSETQSDDDDNGYGYDYVSGSEVILLYNVNHYIPSNEIGLGCMRLEPDVAEKGSSK